MLLNVGIVPTPILYGGTWKTLHTTSAVQRSCSISWESTADIRIGSYFRPSPAMATLPALVPVKLVFQYSFRRAAVASLIAPGAVSTPPGFDPLPKKFELFFSMFSPIRAAWPAANRGETPTSG